MKTLKHERASERKLTSLINGTSSHLATEHPSVPSTQQSTSTKPARRKCAARQHQAPGAASYPLSATVGGEGKGEVVLSNSPKAISHPPAQQFDNSQPSTITPQPARTLSNLSAKKFGNERQPSAMNGDERQRTATKNSTNAPHNPKSKNHGVSIDQAQAPVPAPDETKSEQKQKVSADMIAETENHAGTEGPIEDFITKEEVARRLGRGPRTIDSWKAAGFIPYYKVGKCVYFRWSEVQRGIARIGRRVN